MPSVATRTAEALKPRKALAASGKSRTVGTARSTYSGKRSTRESWRATQSPTPVAPVRLDARARPAAAAGA